MKLSVGMHNKHVHTLTSVDFQTCAGQRKTEEEKSVPNKGICVFNTGTMYEFTWTGPYSAVSADCNHITIPLTDNPTCSQVEN